MDIVVDRIEQLNDQRQQLQDMLKKCQHIKGEPISVSEITRLQEENKELRELLSFAIHKACGNCSPMTSECDNCPLNDEFSTMER